MRKKFVTWYAEEIKKQMNAGVPVESIDVNLKLTSLKALHANWLTELYNVLTTADGRETVLNGWKKSGVTAVFKKEEILPPKDPFSSGQDDLSVTAVLKKEEILPPKAGPIQ